MNEGKSIFSQLIDFLPDREFRRCVARYGGDRYTKKLSCWEQFLAMAFAQLAYRESLRDIEACLGAIGPKLYHMGFGTAVARSALADANESRNWRIFADFAQVLIRTAVKLYADDATGIEDVRDLYALDSTTIDLCLALFSWARFRKHKGAVKMHTLLDLRGNIPTFIRITDGKVADVNVLDEINLEAGAFYVMDRGYIDFERLYRFTLESAFFVVRTKTNVLLQRRYSRPVDKSTGLRSDHTVILTSLASATAYPDALRRVTYCDPETGKRLKFLTNNFARPPLAIAEIYKKRWAVGVSSQGHINQPVQVRPRLTDSSLVAWEASWSESETMKPSDNMLGKEYAQLTRLQRAVNADVASLHENPEAETVYNVRKQQEPIETSPMRRLSPAGYQRRHGEQENVEPGEALGARRRNLVEEATAITASGKCRRRRQGGGSGRTTVDGRAAKRVWREGPGPVSIPLDKVRQG